MKPKAPGILAQAGQRAGMYTSRSGIVHACGLLGSSAQIRQIGPGYWLTLASAVSKVMPSTVA